MAEMWHNGSPGWHNGSPGLIVAWGEIDVSNARDFERALVSESVAADGVCVDLAEVTFIDSSGLRALINARNATGRVVLRRPSDVVLRLLDVTRCRALFDLDS